MSTIAGERIAELRRLLERHSYLYHVENQSEISDSEYDRLFRELLDLEAEHPEFDDPLSPTKRVGEPPSGNFEQHTHRVPMLSLDNAFSSGELRAFDERLRKFATSESELGYVVEPKLDGASISLTYTDGRLILASTRGDGETGEVVTANAKTISGIPLVLQKPLPGTFEIRGEVVMLKKDFHRLNAEKTANGEQPFANPRNAASGGLRQLDSRLTARRRLTFFAHTLGYQEQQIGESQWDAILTLRKLGFPVHHSAVLVPNIESAIERIEEIAATRQEFPFEIDGAVIKANSFPLQLASGFTARSPRWAIAFKYPSEQAYARLVDIVHQVGRTGTITPVAEMEPTYVGGVTVTRATLHNFDDLARKDVRIGDTIIIQRAGDVIPEVVGPVLEKRPPDAMPVLVPERCPVCDTTLEKKRGEIALFCPNRNCPAQISAKLKHFVSRKALDIEGLGQKLIDRLLDLELLSDFASIFELALHREKLTELEKLGEQSVENILQAIEGAKQPPLGRFLFALGIPELGERGSVDLANEFGTLEAIQTADYETLLAVENVGPKTASEISEWFAEEENRATVAKLLSLGVTPLAATKSVEGKFKGQTVVFTGSLERMTRDEAENLIRLHGGKPSGSVSAKTSLVVYGPGAGSKLTKASELGIPTITEEEFLSQLDAE